MYLLYMDSVKKKRGNTKNSKLNCSLALRCAPHQSLPCVKGGGPPQGGSEGLSRQKCYEYACVPAKSATPYCTIPQSKIKDFRQPPLHKGALGAAAPVP